MITNGNRVIMMKQSSALSLIRRRHAQLVNGTALRHCNEALRFALSLNDDFILRTTGMPESRSMCTLPTKKITTFGQTRATTRTTATRTTKPLPLVPTNSLSGRFSQDYHRRSFASTRHTGGDAVVQQEEDEQQAAWTVFSALQKAKQEEILAASNFVSSLEALLPRTNAATKNASTLDQHSLKSIHLPDIAARAKLSSETPDGITEGVTGEDVRTLLQATRSGTIIDINTVRALIQGATTRFQTFRPERLVTIPPLRDEQQMAVVGDLHGSLSDLATVLALMKESEPSENNLLLFNGDLADRGDNGVEIICIVCALCLAYPDFVHINRGNHEDFALSVAYGLIAEIRKKYGPAPQIRKSLRPILDDFFRSLPLATIIEDDALIVHAGPPPPGSGRLSELLLEENPILGGDGLSRTFVNQEDSSTAHDLKVRAGQEIIEALLWSDPIVDERLELLEDFHGDTNDMGEPMGWLPNSSRGAGHRFDADAVRKILHRESLTRMIRSHEAVRRGCVRYEIENSSSYDGDSDTNEPMELFTIFSSSRYPYKEGFNQGAILELKANGKHSVKRFATEDDDPIETDNDPISLTSFHKGFQNIAPSEMNIGTIRRILFEAMEGRKKVLFESLRRAAIESHPEKSGTVSSDRVVDILIETLNLDNEKNLKSCAVQAVLARALAIECKDSRMPANVNLEEFSSMIKDYGDSRTMTAHQSYPWLHSVFYFIDENHDGYINRSEWLKMVDMISSKFPTLQTVEAEQMWELIDADGDGQLSVFEWKRLNDVLDVGNLETFDGEA